MSDMIVGVRLTADGSGLVGQLKLSKAELGNLQQAEKGAADGARDLAQATDQASKSQARAAQGARQASEATAALTKNVGLQRAGWQQVGFQAQDVFASYASGSRLSTIFAQQSGQLASAIALIAQSSEGSKGKLAGLASFLGGPWGIAIGVAVSAGSALVSMLFQADEAAEKVKFSTSGLADSQSILASVMDLTTGKMKKQTEAALGLAFAQAQLNRVNAQKDAAKYRSEVSGLRDANLTLSGGIGGGLRLEDTTPGAQKAIAQGVLERLSDPAGKAGISTADAVQRLDNLRKAGALTDDAYASAAASVANLGVELENIKIADATLRMLQGNGTAADRGLLLKPDAPKKNNGADKAAREAERLAQFSERAAESVARINDEYNTAPRDIDRARQATAQLDSLIGDVNKRLDAGKGLTAAQRAELVRIKSAAEALKPVITASLVKPFQDMLDSQQRQIDLGALQSSGRQADAQALQLTWSLMDKLGAESEDQLATELAKRGVTGDQVQQLYDNLGVMREQTREMEHQKALQDAFLGSIDDMRENLRLTLQELRSEGPKAIGDFFKRSMDVADRLFSEVAVEQLFGSLFADLKDQITGGDKVSKAGDKLADEVGRAGKSIKQTSGDILDLGKAVRQAVADISNAPVASVDNVMGGVAADASGVQGVADIIVTGRKGGGFKDGYEDFFKDLKGSFKDIFGDVFGDKGIFNESLSKTLGQIGAGAQMGAASGSLVTGLLGIKGSTMGGALGGALGSAIAGPLGSIVGGTLGSAVLGAFKSTPKASATITGGSSDDVSVSGNKDSLKKASVGLASSVQETLQQIANEFGGTLGNFAVSIGVRHGDYRVDTTGRGKTKKKSGAVDFDDDEAGAIAYAVMDAITDGGIIGISAAVQKALNSSADLDKAVAEALKVREVEKLLGGIGAELEEQFKAFENQAKDRLRIATQYGFDVVAIEKRNAEDRAKLIDEILTDRVGSLQQLLDDMKHGDLFEGSATDRREALLVEIAKARTAAEAGEDGAADTLASLSRQLVELSRDAYGTAGGEYAADRNSAASAAEAVIRAENERIKAAQEATAQSNAALQQISANSSTTNELLTQMVREIQIFGKTVTIPNFTLDSGLVARTT